MKQTCSTVQKVPESPVLDYLKEKMLRETLKFAAGRQIFCHGCSVILDWKTTVVVSADKGEKHAMLIICRDCFNPKGVEKLKGNGYKVEIDQWK